ncbi:MAG: autotransporter domain-containing protein [Deltaproteobacteria bacterium]|nr:autotransporter domain-containing protein [Deltaproteobacteria bacterium]
MHSSSPGVRFQQLFPTRLALALLAVALSSTALLTVSAASAGVLQEFNITDAVVVEGDAGTVNAVFTVTLDQPDGIPASVEFMTMDGTASAGDQDYQPFSGLLNFAMPNPQVISVPVLGDTNVEPDEMFQVILFNPVDAMLPDPVGVATILNDDVAGVPDLSIGDVGLQEGDSGQTMALFNVTLSFASAMTVQVAFATQDGTATAGGEDYLPAFGTLTIPPGVLSATVAVEVIGDTDVEPDEAFLVNLSNPVNALLVDGQGQGTIFNDDANSPVLSIGDATVLEGDSNLQQIVFTATLSEASPVNVTATYQTQDGTATVADGDYVQATGVVTFIEGSRTSQISLAVSGDTRVELDETFSVVLSAPQGATLGDAQGQGTIVNDDEEEVPLPALSIGDVAVVEGNEGEVAAAFAVTLSSPSTEPVTVAFETLDGSATVEDGDYLAAEGQVVFEPGVTSQMIPVAVLGDTRVEEDETFSLRLSEPQGATLGRSEGTGTIRNDDDAPVVPALSIGDATVDEGDGGSVQAVFTLQLVPASQTSVTVGIRIRDGSASSGEGDFQAQTGALVFRPGETSKTIAATVFGDTRPELDETFRVELSAPPGVTLEDGLGIGTIRDDDLAVVRIADVTVAEGDRGTTAAVFQVSLAQASALPVSVSFATRNGSARSGNDYRVNSGELTFPPGQTLQTVTIEVLGDGRPERDETFFVDLTQPVNATIADGTGEGTIDNDDVEVEMESGSFRLLSHAAVVENEGTIVFQVERVEAGNNAASVQVEAVSGSASAGKDFVAASKTLSWAAGESGLRRFEVALTDDGEVEVDETFSVRLRAPEGATLGDPNLLEVVIFDDDAPLEVESPDGFSLSATVGDRLDLEVRLSRGDGQPVPGAPVEWSIEGDGELLEEVLSTTDGDGVARQRVSLGGTAGVVVVTARLGQTDRFVSFEIRVTGDLTSLLDSRANPGEAAVAAALDQACVDADGEFRLLCDYLLNLDDSGDQIATLGEITPEEVAAQTTMGLNAGRVQLRNVGERVRALRAGGASRGVGNLSASLGGETLTVSSLGRSSWQSYRSPYEIAAMLVTALDEATPEAATLETAAGPGTSQEEEGEAAAKAKEISEALGTSRFGFFINGRVSFGDRPTTEEEAGFDFDTQGLTVGVDYRLRDHFFFGGALGYLKTDSSIAADGGALDTRGTSLLGYASYYGERFYVDATVGFGRNEYQLSRNVDLPQPFQGQRRFVARGDVDGDQLSMGLWAGYEWRRGATTLQGFGDLSSVDAEVDGYAEQGGGPFNLTFGQQDAESLLGEAGLEAAYVVSFSRGVLRPLIRFSYLHEFEDDARLIRARFSQDRSAVEFALPTAEPDRDYFNLTAGVSATLVRGKTIYLTYDRDLSRDDLDNQSVAVGLRLEF